MFVSLHLNVKSLKRARREQCVSVVGIANALELILFECLKSYRRILVTEGIRRQRLELAI